MPARLLPVLLVLPLFAHLIPADAQAPEPDPVHSALEAEVLPAPRPEPAKGKKIICRTVRETCVKTVPYTVCWQVPITVCHMQPDGTPVYETMYRSVCETCYKDVPYTVTKPIYVEVDASDESPAEPEAAEKETAKAPSSALDEALNRLKMHPRDPYLQFVVLQLARRENCASDAAIDVAKLIGDPGREQSAARRESVDLFNIFTGALAVQESLQLDTMRGQRPLASDGAPETMTLPVNGPSHEERVLEEADELESLEMLDELKKQATEGPNPPVSEEPIPPPPEPAPAVEAVPSPAPTPEAKKDYPPVVDVAALKGPEIKSHPWKTMLAGKKPEIEPLAQMVPYDFYYVHFNKLSKLLESADLVDHLGTHFWNQASHEARTQGTAERLKKQLHLPLNLVGQAAQDECVSDVAIVGSDPFIQEGSDVTLLIRLNNHAVQEAFQGLSFFLELSAQAGDVATTGEYAGVAYEHVETADRDVCVYFAYPAPMVQLRTNSLTALKRVIDAINGHTPDGKPVKRLGETREFAYIRTLYPVGAEQEDGLIYLSDPFIRRLVGPEVKLTERRRMVCYNQLRMIGHAAMLFRSEHGRPAESLDELYQAGCLPYPFHGEPSASLKSQVQELLGQLEAGSPNMQKFAFAELRKLGPVCKPLLQEKLASEQSLEVAMSIENLLSEMEDADECCCPCGGCYQLSTDGMSGVCDHHGHTHFLTPCLENPVATVNADEAQAYDAFREDYDKYWRTYFDPIAIRVQATPERYRFETIVLPLIDNSIYKGLSMVLGGAPANLDALPVPKRNIFSMVLRFNKEEWIKQAEEAEKAEAAEAEPEEAGPPENGSEPSISAPKITVKPQASGLNKTCLELVKELGLSEKDINLDNLDLEKFLKLGIGNQIGLHIYDAPPNFDFNASTALGMLMQFAGGTSSHSLDMTEALGGLSEFLLVGGVMSSFNGPVYLSLPVQDVKIVDDFGDQLERIFASLAPQSKSLYKGLAGLEFYRVAFQNDASRYMRAFVVQVGPVKFRWFWARIGSIVYIASQPCVLNDLLALENLPPEPGQEPAHAMIKVRAQNWNEVLDNTYLGWAENHRLACIDNQGPLSSVARAVTASLGKIYESESDEIAKRIVQEADRLHGVHFFCPEGGHYVLSPDGKQMTCSVHGSALEPRQPADPNAEGTIGAYLKQLGGLTATLSFLEDGLRAVVVIDRK